MSINRKVGCLSLELKPAFPNPVNKSSGVLLFRGQSKVREGCFSC
jgi:hypothetical protein